MKKTLEISYWKLLLGLIAVVALTGCDETQFLNPLPPTKTSGLHEKLAGYWYAEKVGPLHAVPRMDKLEISNAEAMLAEGYVSTIGNRKFLNIAVRADYAVTYMLAEYTVTPIEIQACTIDAKALAQVAKPGELIGDDGPQILNSSESLAALVSRLAPMWKGRTCVSLKRLTAQEYDKKMFEVSQKKLKEKEEKEAKEKAKKDSAEKEQAIRSSRGFLGAEVYDIPEFLSQKWNLPAGAIISSVRDNSPAAKARMETGDIIVECDGLKVDLAVTLDTHVRSKAPGSALNLTFYRGKTKKTALVELAQTPED